MPIRSHRNYAIYKSIREDLRYGLLELEDKICVYKNENTIFDYEAYDDLKDSLAEIMTVKEVLDFIRKNQ